MKSFVSLMYHNVVEPKARFPELSPSVTSYFVTRDQFERHVTQLAAEASWLNSRQMQLLFGDAASMKTGKPDRPLVQITFDDGWRGSIDLAGPILQEHGCEALLFVTTDLISRPDFANPHDLRRLPHDVYRVGSHGRTHRLLAQLSDEDIREELRSSRQLLEEIVGYEIEWLSLPGGSADRRVFQIARDVGYRYISTSNIHVNSSRTGPFDIGRVAIKTHTSAGSLMRYVHGDLRGQQLRQKIVRCARRVLNEAAYTRWRRRLLGEESNQNDMTDLSGEPPVAEAAIQ